MKPITCANPLHQSNSCLNSSLIGKRLIFRALHTNVAKIAQAVKTVTTDINSVPQIVFMVKVLARETDWTNGLVEHLVGESTRTFKMLTASSA